MENYKGITINSSDDYGSTEATTREVAALKSFIDRVPYFGGTIGPLDIGGIHGAWDAEILTLTAGMAGEVYAYSHTTDDLSWSGPSFLYSAASFKYDGGGSGSTNFVTSLVPPGGPMPMYGYFYIDVLANKLRIHHPVEGKGGLIRVEYYIYLFNS